MCVAEVNEIDKLPRPAQYAVEYISSKGIQFLPVIDACEPQVLRALQKDKWAIVNKPFAIRTNTHTVFADCL